MYHYTELKTEAAMKEMRGNIEKYLSRAETIKGFVKDEREGAFSVKCMELHTIVVQCISQSNKTNKYRTLHTLHTVYILYCILSLVCMLCMCTHMHAVHCNINYMLTILYYVCYVFIHTSVLAHVTIQLL